MNFLALTTCVVDYYPQFKKSYLGGNSLNLASMWKRLTKRDKVSVIACLGNDKNGDRIEAFLKSTEIDISHLYRREGVTSNNQLWVDAKGERFGIEGAWNGGVYESFLLDEADWVYVSKQDVISIPGNNPNFKELLKRKSSEQKLVVDYLDIENKVPVEETIKDTDVALITANESLLPKCKEMAFKTKKLLVVTLGAKGSYCFFNNKEYHQPAIKVDRVVDTTGCGDAYLAAFSYCYFQTRDITASMKSGALAAANILKFYGGVGDAEAAISK